MNTIAEDRGGHRYIRPSNSAKFVLKQGMQHFFSHELSYSYHGTDAKNADSIINNGLRIPGEILKNGIKVEVACGSAHGKAIYTSKMPLYSEFYSKTYFYKNKYLKLVFMVRQDNKYLKRQNEACGYQSTTNQQLGQIAYKLYKGILDEDDTQLVTFNPSSVFLQAVLIKVCDEEPSKKNGYYDQIVNLIKSMEQ